MLAGRAFLRGFGSFVDVPAIDAVPLHRFFLVEDLLFCNICDQFPVTRLMEFLHFGDLFEGTGNFGETFRLGVLCEVRI